MKRCPITCSCLCHDTGGGITVQHVETGVCPTKLGLPVPPLDLTHYTGREGAEVVVG